MCYVVGDLANNLYALHKMDGLCKPGTLDINFSVILEEIMAMPQDQFLDNFFGVATAVDVH